MDTNDNVPRMVPGPGCDATAGQVRWAPLKSLWLAGMTAVALVAGPATVSWSAVGAFVLQALRAVNPLPALETSHGA